MSEMLLWVLNRAGFEPSEDQEHPPADYWRSKALLYLGAHTLRAAMTVGWPR